MEKMVGPFIFKFILYFLKAGNPDLVTPFGAGPVTSSVSLKTPASEHNVHDTFRYGLEPWPNYYYYFNLIFSFKSAKSDLTPSHPLEASEANV